MIVFLDIDGTYASHGEVPEGHVTAVRQARARGHMVLLCTGRPLVMLGPEILAAGFDGFVTGAGAHVEVGGQVLKDERFPADLAKRTVAVLNEHDAAYILEAPQELLGPPGTPARAARVFARNNPHDDAPDDGVWFLRGLRIRDDLAGASFGKVTVVESRTPIPDLGKAIGAQVAAITSSIPGMGCDSGELYQSHIHKATGVQIVAEHLGFGRESVVAVGDGMNDVEMIAWAGVGVAVQGASPAVLAVADRVTAGPERAGLVDLFRELNLTAH